MCVFDQNPLQRYYLKLLLPNYPDYIGTKLCNKVIINVVKTKIKTKNRNCVLKNRKWIRCSKGSKGSKGSKCYIALTEGGFFSMIEGVVDNYA